MKGYTFHQIKTWVQWCFANHCMCVADTEKPYDLCQNVCCYVTSPGSISGGVSESDRCVLFIDLNKSIWEHFVPTCFMCYYILPCPCLTLHHCRGLLRVQYERNQKPTHMAVAARFSLFYGHDLFHYCNMGKEDSVYGNSLLYCMTSFVPDFRALLDDAPVFDTAKHFRKMGLGGHCPCLMQNRPADKADKFMKSFTFHGSSPNTTMSEAVGVNMWSLLLMGALIGNTNIHPKCSSDFSRNILSLILSKSPPAATPGDKIPIRSINTQV